MEKGYLRRKKSAQPNATKQSDVPTPLPVQPNVITQSDTPVPGKENNNNFSTTNPNCT